MKKSLIAAAIACGVVAIIVFIFSTKGSDRVEGHFASVAELDESGASWFPFEVEILGKAQNISLSTDLDTNDYLVQMSYPDASSLQEFVGGISQVSHSNETIDCGNLKERPECVALKKESGSITVYQIMDSNEVDNSYWIVDPVALKVVGLSRYPDT